LILVSVVERPSAGSIEQFSLFFDAPVGVPDLHGIRALEHRTLGRRDMFIVPVGARSGPPRLYEACFSRFIDPGSAS
jgi:hypothetical protein